MTVEVWGDASILFEHAMRERSRERTDRYEAISPACPESASQQCPLQGTLAKVGSTARAAVSDHRTG